MKKRSFVMVVAMMLVVAMVSVAGTYAWLTSKTGPVTNTFTYGNVSITLDELNVTEYGVSNNTGRGNGNEYKLIPGHTYTKDPTVHVAAGSEDCWLFVKVENGISAIEATGTTTIASQMTTNGWTLVSGETNVYAYGTTVSAGANVPVFGTFTLSGTADVSTYSNAEVKITAYAVQADGNTNAAAAWTNAPATW